SDGRITPNAPVQNHQTYRYVARRIDAILGPYLDKSRSTIHCDGETPSAQKSDERSRRKECLERQLKALTERVEKVSIKKGAPASTYFKCKTLYRAPRAAIDDILDELSKLDWKVCRCDFQADTHIADQCRKDPNNADITVITRDSDLLVYEHIHSITIPIGRAHELTTFTKANVMSSLELPSARHLLLAALLSKNDYSSSIQRYTLQKNAKIVQGIDLDAGSSRSIPTDSVKDAIRKYLERVQTPHSRTPDHYEHAISAFVECRENRSRNADQNPRYTPYTIAHISDASPVKCEDLVGMAVSEPRQSSKTTASETRTKPAKPAETTSNTSSGSSSSSSNRVKSRAKDEKDEIGKVFKTVTLTMGALTSCIRRATSLSKEESKHVSNRINEAVHVLNLARTIGFKAIENYIYLKVAGNPSVDSPMHEETRSLDLAESDPHNAAEVLDPHETSQSVEKGSSEFHPLDPQETPQSVKQDSFKFDPLDLILHPSDGTTVVRNLLSIVLKGDVKGGKPTTSPGAIAARETAKEIYKEFCRVLEDFEPVNPQSIPLGSPLMELAENVHSAIRAHFRRLPGLILNKVIDCRQRAPVPKLQKAYLVLTRFLISDEEDRGKS
ncbi:hypothetical protein BGX34_005751, partial [Mortierella sp. NVP85]